MENVNGISAFLHIMDLASSYPKPGWHTALAEILEDQTKHELTSHSCQVQSTSVASQLALESILLSSVYMKFSPIRLWRIQRARRNHPAWICCRPGWSLPGIGTLAIRKHKSSKNKLVVCCSLHETQQRDQNKDFKTPDWKEVSLGLGWIVRYIKDLLSLLFTVGHPTRKNIWLLPV